jgi:hypothetical protein
MLQKSAEERHSINMFPGPEALWSVMTDYQREVLGFMSMRLTKDADLLRQMQKCRSWEEATLLHSKWMQTTFSDYSRELAKVLNITPRQVEGGGARNLRLVA